MTSRRHQGLVRAPARLAPARGFGRLSAKVPERRCPAARTVTVTRSFRALMRLSVRRETRTTTRARPVDVLSRKLALARVSLRVVAARRTLTVNCAFARAPFGPASFQTNALRLLSLARDGQELELRTGGRSGRRGRWRRGDRQRCEHLDLGDVHERRAALGAQRPQLHVAHAGRARAERHRIGPAHVRRPERALRDRGVGTAVRGHLDHVARQRRGRRVAAAAARVDPHLSDRDRPGQGQQQLLRPGCGRAVS